MEYKRHPTFGDWFLRIMVRGWVAAAVSFCGALLSFKLKYDALGWVFAVCFGLAFFAAAVYLIYGLFHVACPRCGRNTQTLRDPRSNRWVARCKACKISWDLGIGARDDIR